MPAGFTFLTRASRSRTYARLNCQFIQIGRVTAATLRFSLGSFCSLRSHSRSATFPRPIRERKTDKGAGIFGTLNLKVLE